MTTIFIIIFVLGIFLGYSLALVVPDDSKALKERLKSIRKHLAKRK